MRERLLGATPAHVPFSTYVYATCPACGRKDWAEGRKYFGLIGPRGFYATVFGLIVAMVLMAIYLEFYFRP